MVVFAEKPGVAEHAVTWMYLHEIQEMVKHGEQGVTLRTEYQMWFKRSIMIAWKCMKYKG